MGDKPLSEPKRTRFTDACMRHHGEMGQPKQLLQFCVNFFNIPRLDKLKNEPCHVLRMIISDFFWTPIDIGTASLWRHKWTGPRFVRNASITEKETISARLINVDIVSISNKLLGRLVGSNEWLLYIANMKAKINVISIRRDLTGKMRDI